MTDPRTQLPALFGRTVRAIHCVGIGGMGLGPLAIYLARLGYTVTGEDDAMTAPMRAHLDRAGIRIFSIFDSRFDRLSASGLETIGSCRAECVSERQLLIENPKSKIQNPPDLLVTSTAISPTHPAAIAAKQLRLPTVRRGELLAEIVRHKKLVAICGSHGKTTTTAMLVTALRRAGFSAGYILGGLFNDTLLSPADTGATDWVVAEIDESDGTIENFSPEITIATNLDWDHPDHYRTQADIEAAFAALFARTHRAILSSTGFQPMFSAARASSPCSDAVRASSPRDGASAPPPTPTPTHYLFAPTTSTTTTPATPVATTTTTATTVATATTITTATTPTFRYQITSTRTAADIQAQIQTLALAGQFPITTANIRALGDFNATNAAAALAAAHLMGATLTPYLLAAYPGVHRRQAILLATDTLTVVEDYAHHPAEIRALFTNLQSRIRLPSQIPESSPARLLAVFQPHRYSRTAQFKTDFADALSIADRSYLIDVYPAGEPPVPGGATADLYATLRAAHPAHPVTYRAEKTDATLTTLARDVRPGDWVVFVGAGDIDHSARAWLTLATEYEKAASHWNKLGVALRGTLSPASKIRIEEPLAPKTTMRTGGAARLYAEPAHERDLALLLDFARARALSILPLGRGSNLIVPDEGVDALVVSLAHPHWQHFEIRPPPENANSHPLTPPLSPPLPLITCGAGFRLKNLCGLAADAGLAGFEFLEGIPGNLGGALRMNAGAMGNEIFNIIDEVRLMTRTGEIRTLRPSDMGVTYRRCAALSALGAIALGATLRPMHAEPRPAIATRMDQYRARRQTTQPREPSAGCIFKNPPNDTAGRLIDTAGLKGAHIGGAEVSALHANFIINRGNATTTDIIQLIRHVRATVFEKHAITLAPEVILYGANWEDRL
jgi:UDP-N-acetylenolpyruvoylglucosamine reductase